MLTRKAIAFITLHDHPEYMNLVLHPGEEFTMTLQIFGVRKSVTLTADELNVCRATYILLNLQDPVEWSVWVSKLFFPASLDQPEPFFL